MTWPTGPPPMPPAGWYRDPEQDMMWRWWDGATWTDQRAPVWTPPPRDPTSFSTWFEQSFACVKVAVRRVGLLVAGAWLAVGIASVALVVAASSSGRGQELRRLLDDEANLIAPADTSITFELSDAEADRAWELVQGIFWSVLPWAIVLGVAFVIVSAWTYALVGQVAWAAIDDGNDDESGDGAARTATLTRRALGRTPAVIASSLLTGLVVTGAIVLLTIPVVVVIVAGGSGAAIGLTVFFCVCAGLALSVWLWGKLALAVVIAAIGGHGLGLRRSWALTHGRFWYVVGRLLVAGLITGAVSGVANIAGNVVTVLGFVVGFGVFVVLTAIVSAIATIISASAHAVIVDQVERSPAAT